MMDIKFPKFGNEFQCYDAEIMYMQKVLTYTTLLELEESFRLLRYQTCHILQHQIKELKKNFKASILTPKAPCEILFKSFETHMNTVSKLLGRISPSMEHLQQLINLKSDLERLVTVAKNQRKIERQDLVQVKQLTALDIVKLENMYADETKKESLMYSDITDLCLKQNIQYPFNKKWESCRVSQCSEVQSKISRTTIRETKRYDNLSERENIFASQTESTEYLITVYDAAITKRMELYTIKMEEMEFHTTKRKTALNDVRNKMETTKKNYLAQGIYIDNFFKEIFIVKIQRWWKPIFKKIKKRRLRRKIVEQEDSLLVL